MHIAIEWRDGKWPTFKIILSKVQGAEPFLEIKDCRLIDGKNGAFVSYPARKDDKGKYWPYLYGGETFNAHVVKLAQAGLPQTARPKPKGGSGFDDMADDIPF